MVFKGGYFDKKIGTSATFYMGQKDNEFAKMSPSFSKSPIEIKFFPVLVLIGSVPGHVSAT
jgi:hypothetical protein